MLKQNRIVLAIAGAVFLAIVVLEMVAPSQRGRRLRFCIADSIGCNRAQSQPDVRNSGRLYRGDLHGVNATDQAWAVAIGSD